MLALVLLTIASDLGLVLSSPMGYSVGTYAARAMGLISGLIVGGTLVRWMLSSIERSDLLMQYATIAESSPNITFLTDESGRNVYTNERWTDLTGSPPSQALGTGWQAFVHPDDLSFRLSRQWGMSESYQVRLRDVNGSYVWHLIRYGPVRDRSGQRIGWVGTLSNVDRERRALDESRHLAEQLRRQVESEREVTAALRTAILRAS